MRTREKKDNIFSRGSVHTFVNKPAALKWYFSTRVHKCTVEKKKKEFQKVKLERNGNRIRSSYLTISLRKIFLLHLGYTYRIICIKKDGILFLHILIASQCVRMKKWVAESSREWQRVAESGGIDSRDSIREWVASGSRCIDGLMMPLPNGRVTEE